MDIPVHWLGHVLPDKTGGTYIVLLTIVTNGAFGPYLFTLLRGVIDC